MVGNDELGALIERLAPAIGVHRTVLERVSLVQSSVTTLPMPTLYEPSLCFVASGRKRVELGDTSYVYDAATFLAVSVDLPVTGAVVEASVDAPFLCLRLDIDTRLLGEMLHGRPHPREPAVTPIGLVLGRSTPELTDAVARLLRLLDTPADAAALAPLVEREILYRVLTGPCASMMRHIAGVDGGPSRIGRAIAWLRTHYRDAFTIEDVARAAGMSASAFHQHFRAVTTMSPLQFRNARRLQEARRLMVTQGADAAAAGFAVGFQSPSQFSRDYARLFGDAPHRDARRLREQPDWLALQA